jgi:hypothetical protein
MKIIVSFRTLMTLASDAKIPGSETLPSGDRLIGGERVGLNGIGGCVWCDVCPRRLVGPSVNTLSDLC